MEKRRWEEPEKRREEERRSEKIREEKESEERRCRCGKGRKVAIHCAFPTWRFILLEKVRSFRVPVISVRNFRCFMSFDSATLPSGAIPKPWESENVSSPSFWDLRIFAGVLRIFAGFLPAGNFQRFRWQLHFAQLNPQTLKSTLDIVLPSKSKEF